MLELNDDICLHSTKINIIGVSVALAFLIWLNSMMDWIFKMHPIFGPAQINEKSEINNIKQKAAFYFITQFWIFNKDYKVLFRP